MDARVGRWRGDGVLTLQPGLWLTVGFGSCTVPFEGAGSVGGSWQCRC